MPNAGIFKIIYCNKCGKAFDLANNSTHGDVCTSCKLANKVLHPMDPPTLKVFQVRVVDTVSTFKMQITVLHFDEADAEAEIKALLNDQGYDVDTLGFIAKELDGPFRAGYILARSQAADYA